jgi:hypothetical protein
MPRRARRPRLDVPPIAGLGCALALALVLGGCGDDSTGPDEGAALPGETDALPDDLGGPAAGLRIVRVEANQGVGVDLVRDGALVPIDQRAATLVRERDTLVRVDHIIDDPQAWIARELVGILHILPAVGGERRRTRTLFVAADSDPRRLSTSFYFSLLAEEAQPGTRIWIELREADASLDTSSLGPGDSETVVAELGFDPAHLALRVVLVPVRYEALDPPREPDIDADDLALLHDYLLQQNPVQRVELSVREQPIVRTETLTNLGSLLAPTREAKLADGADANVYYHALVDVGGPAVAQVAGIALLTDASKQASSDRVAATVYYKRVVTPDPDADDQTPIVYAPTNSARTFVHEIGHNQGLSHVACPNASAAGPDLDYPHANGKIGVYGFGIRDFHVYTPGASHDYMSYCGNSWVSDWTWNKTLTRIRTLSEWDLESADTPTVSTLVPTLVGIVGADGFEEWTIVAGVPASATQDDPHDPHQGAAIELRFDRATSSPGFDRATSSPGFDRATSSPGFADRADLRIPAQIALLSDDATILISAPLPYPLDPSAAAPLEGLTSLAWVYAGSTHDVALARVRP